MFEELFGTVKLVFTLTIVIGAIVVVAGLVRGGIQAQEAEERRQEEARKMRDNINRIKAASKRWSNETKMFYLQELEEEYNRLSVSQRLPMGQGYASKTIIWTNIDGSFEGITLDTQGLGELYNYISNQLDG